LREKRIRKWKTLTQNLKSDVIDPDEGAALVKIGEGTIDGAKSRAEDEHLAFKPSKKEGN
jgi:hypothetical protein